MDVPEHFRGARAEWLGRLGYGSALELQSQLADELAAGRGTESLLLLEHEPVYTIGRRRDRSSLGNPAHLPHPATETNRGGQATYHGPGQLVGYALLDLTRRGRDLHVHLRAIEDLLVAALGAWGIAAGRRDGLTGAWVGERKIASVGVGVRRWITMHGFALNVTEESLPPFDAITPCGIGGVEMTAVGLESNHPDCPSSTAVAAARIVEAFASTPPPPGAPHP